MKLRAHSLTELEWCKLVSLHDYWLTEQTRHEQPIVATLFSLLVMFGLSAAVFISRQIPIHFTSLA